MSKIKLTEKNRLLWNTTTKDIIVDIEDAGVNSVTECWRDGIEGAEFVTTEEKESKIESDGLKKIDSIGAVI